MTDREWRDMFIDTRIVANDLREALYDLVHGDYVAGLAAAEALLAKYPVCIHCGQMDAAHDALHRFTP